MMEKMGHAQGKGLGREGQGIAQPVKNTGWVIAFRLTFLCEYIDQTTSWSCLLQ
jgi:hypothetical protein